MKLFIILSLAQIVVVIVNGRPFDTIDGLQIPNHCRVKEIVSQPLAPVCDTDGTVYYNMAEFRCTEGCYPNIQLEELKPCELPKNYAPTFTKAFIQVYSDIYQQRQRNRKNGFGEGLLYAK